MQKEDGTPSLMRRVLGTHRRRLVLSCVLFSAHQILESLVPVVIGAVIDRAVTTGDGGSLARWLVLLVGLFTCLSFAWRFGDRYVERAVFRSDHDLRVEATTRLLDPRGSAAGTRRSGELLSVATSDTERTAFGNFAVVAGCGAVAALVVAAVVLVRVSLPLGLLVLLGLPPLLLLLQALAKPLERRSGTEQEAAAGASAVAGDVLHGLRVVKGIGAERAAADRYRTASRESLGATVRAATYEGVHRGTTVTLTGAFLAAVAIVGGRLAAEGTISVGEAVAAIGLTQFLLGPLSRLSWAIATFFRARASAGRVDEVLRARPWLLGSGAAAAAAGRIALRGVTAPGLDGVSVELGAGELVGVVADGVAARSLVDLLGLERVPDAGVVELDGLDVHDLEPDAVRRAMLVEAHEGDLFEGSLAGNVGARAASDDHAESAMAAAAVDDVAANLPAGASSHLPARGTSLSGGQRQRVALGRALAADAPVLVLHDPTSAIDAVTEQRIASGIRALRTGRTTVVVTTSATLLAATDRAVLLVGGRVVADGTHAELVEDPRYRELVLG